MVGRVFLPVEAMRESRIGQRKKPNYNEGMTKPWPAPLEAVGLTDVLY